MGKILNKVSFQELFNPKFLQENSKFTSMDDMIWRSGFGIMNLMEVENVNQDKWNEYIAKNTECETWHDFGKVAMIDWMKNKLEEVKNPKLKSSLPELNASAILPYEGNEQWK